MAFFEYEYEYRPRGRTEYEYEVWFFGLLFFSCSCSNFAHSVPGSPGGDFVARAFQPEHIGDSDVGRGVLVCGECV
ncbi:MAG: hypothetical protein ACKPJJ_29160, partial [Planctomycetaceae bacterium]